MACARISVGSARLVKPLRARRLAEPFEALRDAADAHRQSPANGRPSSLPRWAPIADHNMRSTLGEELPRRRRHRGFDLRRLRDADAAATPSKPAAPPLACICSTDAIYADKAEATAKALKAAGAKLVLQAGRPGDKEAAYKAAGVDSFLAAGADAVTILKGLQGQLTA